MVSVVRQQPATSNDEIDVLAGLGQVNKAASDELRLLILQVLKSDSFGVLELCSLFDLAQPKLSHHLKVLLNAGLVATRREGNSIFYQRSLVLADSPLSSHIAQLFRTIDQVEIDAGLNLRMTSIREAREQRSVEFFAKNSARFTEHQALIVEREQYSPNLLELIDALELSQQASVIEVGPGEGELLCQLADKFDSVAGIDNSAAMLSLAEQRAAAEGINNIELVQADATQPHAKTLAADLVICDMVLHHLASPSQAIAQFSHLLKPAGYLLIADLASHNQEWVKESCGDVWLGFASEDLIHWAESAQLTSRQSAHLALRNGFQVQLYLFQI